MAIRWWRCSCVCLLMTDPPNGLFVEFDCLLGLVSRTVRRCQNQRPSCCPACMWMSSPTFTSQTKLNDEKRQINSPAFRMTSFSSSRYTHSALCMWHSVPPKSRWLSRSFEYLRKIDYHRRLEKSMTNLHHLLLSAFKSTPVGASLTPDSIKHQTSSKSMSYPRSLRACRPSLMSNVISVPDLLAIKGLLMWE
ncbi:hypothetical protein BU25DRAFT_195632 [Macroventuria anomochaeta]|uniref:Uncharacterized protein n=1 Tax=Macroventuria anomochaeta TaxID=301207 RepID=A0ACB6SF68_9PLEO|nr:uncharacterized protein BU25DRAFT_195632 [Macroventuria anomochaeta]KAF2631732.1 hypothetical protein BU25DRAFT_195632 [Macroventuria anomochaeta]